MMQGGKTKLKNSILKEYNEWLGTVNSVGVSENCTAEDIHAMYRDAFELPTNMQAPVHTRWMTIMKAVVAFRGNFIKIYFFTVAIKQWKNRTESTAD